MRHRHPSAAATCRALLLLALLLPACEGDPIGPPPPITHLPRELTLAERQVIGASNAFAFDLLREVSVRETDGPNIFLSPLSASMALGITLNGAANRTFDQMRSALRFGELSQEEINDSYRGLLDLLLGLDRTVELSIANSTWAREGVAFAPEYFDVVRDYFDAEARELDFGLPTAKDTINDWVDRATRGRIDSIVDEIAPEHILFIINAVYFKGSWTQRFDPGRTAPAPFLLDDGSEVQVRMMRQQGVPLRLGADGDGTVLAELLYGGGAFAMVLVLPPRGVRFAEFVPDVDDARWSRWMESIGDVGDATVGLPRFELDYEKELNESLQDLGMQDAFIPHVADLSRLVPANNVYIDFVKQKTFLRVDEEGTEAAAATGVGAGVTSAGRSFIVDRPFLVAIRERLSGTILFLGAIGDPR